MEREAVSVQQAMGERFGEYWLVCPLAQGGMAEIFLAKAAAKAFARFVAFKRILPHLCEDREFVNMFIDEAKIASSLSHANIIQVCDLGQVDNRYFIAMEYVQGKDIRAMIRRCVKLKRFLHPSHVVFIGQQMLAGLGYAHAKRDPNGKPMDIVHRDVSPQNIIVSYNGDVKIIDFGIAKASNKIVRTQAGRLKGKFSYMSPEQASGLAVDQRNDIFATGIVLYEMLTKRRLFKAETEVETLERVQQARVPRFKTLGMEMDGELEEVLLKALAKSPEDRYPDAESFRRALFKVQLRLYPGYTVETLADEMKELFSKEIVAERTLLAKYETMSIEDGSPVTASSPMFTPDGVPVKGPMVESAVTNAVENPSGTPWYMWVLAFFALLAAAFAVLVALHLLMGWPPLPEL